MKELCNPEAYECNACPNDDGLEKYCHHNNGSNKDKPINQCDGCMRGLPIVDGLHRNPDGSYDMIGCTKDRYK